MVRLVALVRSFIEIIAEAFESVACDDYEAR
jgi:hypothetical protein